MWITIRSVPGAPARTVGAGSSRVRRACAICWRTRSPPTLSWLYAKCHHHIPTTAIPTAAVVATGDGVCALLYNPYFLMELDFDGVTFVLFH